MIKASCIIIAAGLLLFPAGVETNPADRGALRVMGDGYPRAFFFRMSEGAAANPQVKYQDWDGNFSRLMGIMGKVLEEEVPGRSLRNIDFFKRFKAAHPDQAVLLHYNGNARDPRFESERFFAGHWLYHNGAAITADVPAQEGETDIRVSDASLFEINIGRYKTANEDIGLCVLDAGGKPDWKRSEQVQLLSVDRAGKVIRVRRGAYGTKPVAFAAGRAYAAAHCTEGPWGAKSNLLWCYNYSTRCPRDDRGKSCGEIHVEHLGELFSAGGVLAAFDGLEFDVLHNQTARRRGKRGPDCDADGVPDAGIFSGSNEYSRGVVEFCRLLRRRLGDGKIIMADGALGRDSDGSQRAFGILNGIESEGWPRLSDFAMRDWSGGMNRLLFWRQNARSPHLSYINHKYTMPGEKPGQVDRPQVPFATHRLVFAAAVFTDSAVCYSYAPADDPGGLAGIWDELRMGRENRLGWLSRPVGPVVRLALKQPDRLGGAGKPPGKDLIKRLSGDEARFELDRGELKIAAKDPRAAGFRLRLAGVPCDGPDLFVMLTVRADPRKGDPAEMARILRVSGPAQDPKSAEQAATFMTYVNETDFAAGFYFSDIRTPEVDLELQVESGEPVWIREITAHAHPDAMLREFEHGLVLANPSARPYTFRLDRLLPGGRFRRLRGTSGQDTEANDGTPAGGSLTLQPKEGLFLVRE